MRRKRKIKLHNKLRKKIELCNLHIRLFNRLNPARERRNSIIETNSYKPSLHYANKLIDRDEIVYLCKQITEAAMLNDGKWTIRKDASNEIKHYHHSIKQRLNKSSQTLKHTSTPLYHFIKSRVRESSTQTNHVTTIYRKKARGTASGVRSTT